MRDQALYDHATGSSRTLTTEDRGRLLDLDVIEEAHRLRSLGWPPLAAMHAALARPPIDYASPRPVATNATSSPPPANPQAPAGALRRLRTVLVTVAVAVLALGAIALLAALGGE